MSKRRERDSPGLCFLLWRTGAFEASRRSRGCGGKQGHSGQADTCGCPSRAGQRGTQRALPLLRPVRQLYELKRHICVPVAQGVNVTNGGTSVSHAARLPPRDLGAARLILFLRDKIIAFSPYQLSQTKDGEGTERFQSFPPKRKGQGFPV